MQFLTTEREEYGQIGKLFFGRAYPNPADRGGNRPETRASTDSTHWQSQWHTTSATIAAVRRTKAKLLKEGPIYVINHSLYNTQLCCLKH